MRACSATVPLPVARSKVADPSRGDPVAVIRSFAKDFDPSRRAPPARPGAEGPRGRRAELVGDSGTSALVAGTTRSHPAPRQRSCASTRGGGAGRSRPRRSRRCPVRRGCSTSGRAQSPARARPGRRRRRRAPSSGGRICSRAGPTDTTETARPRLLDPATYFLAALGDQKRSWLFDLFLRRQVLVIAGPVEQRVWGGKYSDWLPRPGSQCRWHCSKPERRQLVRTAR